MLPLFVFFPDEGTQPSDDAEDDDECDSEPTPAVEVTDPPLAITCMYNVYLFSVCPCLERDDKHVRTARE